jgi:hypothetical protein
MKNKQKTPWILRHCPESKRRILTLVFTFAGLISKLIFFVAGLLGILIAPLLLATQHPTAPIAIPIRWLQTHFSHDTARFVYFVIQFIIIGILTYAMIVYDYLRYNASERNKSETV